MMSFNDLITIAMEIYAEKRLIQSLSPGGVVDIPPIKQGSGKDRLIFHVTVEKPAA